MSGNTGSWVVGSICAFPDQDLSIDGAPDVTIAFIFTGTYLDHASTGLSMMKSLAARLLLSGVTGATVILRQDGFVQIDASASFTIEWTDTALRDALGFTGDLTPTATSFTAPNKSDLLWVARSNETPGAVPLGIVGDKKHDVVRVQSRDGTQVTRTFGSATRDNSYTWFFISKSNAWDTEASGSGELFVFYETVLSPGAKAFLYRQVVADAASASAVTLINPLGPYELFGNERAIQLTKSAGHQLTDARWDWDWPAHSVPEYTS